jgi:hypothetical protein
MWAAVDVATDSRSVMQSVRLKWVTSIVQT